MKKYDVSAKVGSYQKDGQSKAIWKTVGQIRDDGNGEYLLLDKTFNPAGIPCEPHKDQISLSLFTPRDNNQQGGYQQQSNVTNINAPADPNAPPF
jgi:hypothetical protein